MNIYKFLIVELSMRSSSTGRCKGIQKIGNMNFKELTTFWTTGTEEYNFILSQCDSVLLKLSSFIKFPSIALKRYHVAFYHKSV